MRGCLVTLGLLVVVAVAVVWLLLPPLVGTLTQGALVAAGVSADTTTVTVGADPPPKLLTLEADTIHLAATNARYHGIEAVGVDVTLRDVKLVDRTYGGVAGTLQFVSLPAGPGRPAVTIPQVTLSGSSDRVTGTMTFSAVTAQELAAGAVESAVGAAPSEVTLTGPDRVRIRVKGVTVDGRLAIRDDGGLVLVPPAKANLADIPIVVPGPDVPIHIESFRIVGGGLVLAATFDPGLG